MKVSETLPILYNDVLRRINICPTIRDVDERTALRQRIYLEQKTF